MAKDFHYSLRTMEVMPRHFVDTVPISCREGRIFVSVDVAGKQCEFLLDTGASFGELYEDCGIEVKDTLGRIRSVTDANGIERNAEIVVMPEFKFGKVVISGYPIQSSARKRRGRACGSLGFALFNKGIVAKIDLQNQWIVITDDKNFFKREGGVEVPYKQLRFTPQIAVEIGNGWREQAVFDTGNPHFLLLNSSRWDMHIAADDTAKTYVVGKMTGEALRGAHGTELQQLITFLKLPSVRFAGQVFKDVETRTFGGPTNIGVAMLRQGCVIINPHKRAVVFQPYDGCGHIAVEPSHREIYINASADGCAQVGFVRQDSRFDISGFCSGDIIVSINGRDIKSYKDYKGYPFIVGRTYRFVLRSPLGLMHEASIEYLLEK